MHKQFKRLSAWMLGAVMMMTGLGGCGDSGKSEADSGSVSSAESSGNSIVPVDLVQSDGSAKVTIADAHFQVGGKKLWLCGTNTPWDNWNDFGHDFDYDFWDTHFAALHDAGINSSRVWILCSGDYGIQFDGDGKVTGMTEQFWNDTDRLMSVAAKHKIYIMATMMSFDCCKTGNRNHKKFRAMMQDADLTQSYVDNYIIPFAERYDSNDYLFSIDLCNEPDWIHENEESGRIDWKPLVTFFGKCAQGIHQHSDILVTTGIAYIPNNSDKRGTNVMSDDLLKYYAGEDSYMDFYSVHFYDWMIQWHNDPFKMSPADYGLLTSKPNVLGECSAKGSVQDGIDLVQAGQMLYDNGWDGVFPWTSTGTDDNGGFEEVTAYSKHMEEQISDLIFPLGKDS
jgi:hypothetical protein